MAKNKTEITCTELFNGTKKRLLGKLIDLTINDWDLLHSLENTLDRDQEKKKGSKCPSCNFETEPRTMTEDGIHHNIRRCTNPNCIWWG